MGIVSDHLTQDDFKYSSDVYKPIGYINKHAEVVLCNMTTKKIERCANSGYTLLYIRVN